jgi:hypothetical protein
VAGERRRRAGGKETAAQRGDGLLEITETPGRWPGWRHRLWGQAGAALPFPRLGGSTIAARATLPPGVGPTTLFASARGSGLVLAAAFAATRTARTGLILAATFSAARTTRPGLLLVRFAGIGILARTRHLSHPSKGART